MTDWPPFPHGRDLMSECWKAPQSRPDASVGAPTRPIQNRLSHIQHPWSINNPCHWRCQSYKLPPMNKTKAIFIIAALFAGSLFASESEITIDAPTVVLNNVPFDLTVTGESAEGLVITAGGVALKYGDVAVDDGMISIKNVVLSGLGSREIQITTAAGAANATVYGLPGFTSILPPLVAIALALITKQVVLSLFCGVWLGAMMTMGFYNPFFGFLRTVDIYLLQALTDRDHMSIVLFTMTLGGMVGIVSRSGGTQGIVVALAKYAKTRRSGSLATWAMGLLIFFDDYSNSLLVGNTMRPFTDKLRISREKLSYLVDSTSAPIASIALVSTWIGFELGLINSSFQALEIEGNAYVTFISSIPYSFYSIMALVMVGILAYTGRDFGPMYKAERRALEHGLVLREGATPLIDKEFASLLPPEGTRSHWYTAILPIVTMIVALLIGLYMDGLAALDGNGESMRDIIGAANSFKVLIWAAFAGTIVAATLAIGTKILNISETIDAFLIGFKAMLIGIIILTLARSLQLVAADIHTADYIFYMTEDILNPRFLPAITFVIAALVSFSTGTSWGTMAIMVPLVVPLAYTLPVEAGLGAEAQQAIFLGSIGAILSGAIFGDHCSPISDTTVMSSIASGADHVDHVRTQLPIGLLVGGVTLAVGYIPAGFGLNPWIGNILAMALLLGFTLKFGKNPEEGLDLSD